MNKLLHLRPEIIAFFSWAWVMVFEILGSRVVWPYIGNSLFVWTSLIAVILWALSLGYYQWWKIADRNANLPIISFILLLVSISLLLLVLIKDPVLLRISNIFPDVRISSIWIAVFLFSPTSYLLWMLSPIVTKIRLIHLESSWAVVWKIGSIWTVWSIVGTLWAGFFLIPFFGVTQLLIVLALFFLILSIFCDFKNHIYAQWIVALWLICMFIVFSNMTAYAALNNSFTYDTSYSHIRVSERIDQSTGREVKDLRIDDITHAWMYQDNNDLVYQYTKYYDIFDALSPNAQEIVMFWGAAYSYPKHFLEKYPDKHLDVVEIDPKITQIAKKHFRLQETPKLEIHHQDARVFLNTNVNTYDAILGDAFGSFVSIPYQLTTREVAQKKFDMLSDDWVVVLNLIASLSWPNAQFLEAEYKTYAEIFPEVFIIPVYSQVSQWSQNIMLVASKNPELIEQWIQVDEYKDYFSKIMKLEIPSDTQVLTDNFAPVDYMVAWMHN